MDWLSPDSPSFQGGFGCQVGWLEGRLADFHRKKHHEMVKKTMPGSFDYIELFRNLNYFPQIYSIYIVKYTMNTYSNWLWKYFISHQGLRRDPTLHPDLDMAHSTEKVCPNAERKSETSQCCHTIWHRHHWNGWISCGVRHHLRQTSYFRLFFLDWKVGGPVQYTETPTAA